MLFALVTVMAMASYIHYSAGSFGGSLLLKFTYCNNLATHLGELLKLVSELIFSEKFYAFESTIVFSLTTR